MLGVPDIPDAKLAVPVTSPYKIVAAIVPAAETVVNVPAVPVMLPLNPPKDVTIPDAFILLKTD